MTNMSGPASAARVTSVPVRWLPTLAPILGVLTAFLVLLYGIVLSAPAGGIFIFAPAVVLALIVGNPPRDHHRRYWILAMAPLAMGILAGTVLIGRLWLDEGLDQWWWLMGGFVSAAPFLLAGSIAEGHLPASRPRHLTDNHS